MVFPAGKATEMMAAEVDHFQPDLSGDIRPLPCPALGDAGVCFRGLQKEVATGNEYETFYLTFKKGDIVETFSTIGPDVNFSLVKDIAIRSAAKIPEPDRATPTVLQTTIPVTTTLSGKMTFISYYNSSNTGVVPINAVPGSYVEPTGTVLFTSYPLAVNIRFDNIERGKNPLTIRDIPTGQHTLYAYKEGHIPYHSFFYVSYQGGYTTRHIQLEANQTA